MPSSVARWTMNVLAAGCIAGGAASTLQAQAPGRAPAHESPRPLARLSASMQALQDSVASFARRQMGVPYRFGASSPDRGFDCSGLVKYVMAHFGVRLPRTSREQALVGERIERDVAALRPGDLLTFGYGRRISHVGIYIGRGRFVHAPTRGERVREESLDRVKASWWRGARRIIALGDTLASTDPVPAN